MLTAPQIPAGESATVRPAAKKSPRMTTAEAAVEMIWVERSTEGRKEATWAAPEEVEATFTVAVNLPAEVNPETTQLRVVPGVTMEGTQVAPLERMTVGAVVPNPKP